MITKRKSVFTWYFALSLKNITTYLAYFFFPDAITAKEILKTMGIMLLLLLYISFLRLFPFFCFLMCILFAYIVRSSHSLPEIHISIVDNDALQNQMCIFSYCCKMVGESKSKICFKQYWLEFFTKILPA